MQQTQTYDLYVDGELAWSGASNKSTSGGHILKIGTDPNFDMDFTTSRVRVANGILLPEDDPAPVEVITEEPSREGNVVTIPDVEGVVYTDGDGNVLSGVIALTEGQALTVTASAEDGYVLADGETEWVFEYEDATDPDDPGPGDGPGDGGSDGDDPGDGDPGSDGPGDGQPGGDGDDLVVTGSSAAMLTIVIAILLAAGVGLVAARRRKAIP